ncbi:MAG: c-type cytochrome [Burkholderiales bacterium]
MKSRWLLALGAGLFVPAAALAQGLPKADPAQARELVTQVCASCHAEDGNSTLSANPVLAGQHAEYTLKQLMNFRPQDGKPAERPSAVMAGMVTSLSAGELRNLAAYFEIQRPKPRAARDPDLVKLGQAIYRGGILAKNVAACTACHGPNGSGIPAQFPRLAGQFAEYTSAQLRAFRAGERANDPNRMMRSVAERLSDREIAAVAEYIAGLR